MSSSSIPDDGSVDAEHDPTSVEIPLPPPSPTFPTFEALLDYLQDFHRDNGAAVVKRRSGNRRMVNGVSMVTQYWLICDRGNSRPSVGRGIRQATSGKTDCPFAINAKTSQKLGWAWVYECHGAHNHPPSTDPSAHAVHRRRTAQQRALASSLVKHKALKAGEMRSIMQEVTGTPTFFTKKDIYNDRQKLKRAELSQNGGNGPGTGPDPNAPTAAPDAADDGSAIDLSSLAYSSASTTKTEPTTK